ncbi:MAG: hypothetical protein EZS28_006407 [Streblomastix strix]|uniref:Uncharacterized protein n=1 Tax=Streblomastix strix TaxID=222440 RepID=A0A5J4WU41_9EUKA|nr:MAG: hypothetical protein EZS28_006407 [Streblomastix strix]
MMQNQFGHYQDGIDCLANINADVRNLVKENISKGSQYQFPEQLQKSTVEDGNSIEQVDEMMRKIKRRKLEQDNTITAQIVDIPAQQHTILSSNQLQIKFDEELKKQVSYQSKDEEIAAKKFVQMLEGICQYDIKSFDPSMFVTTPVDRQILINKIDLERSDQKMDKIVD